MVREEPDMSFLVWFLAVMKDMHGCEKGEMGWLVDSNDIYERTLGEELS